MRVLFTLLLFLSAVVVADEEPMVIEQKSYFEYLKGEGNTDCQAFLINADALVNASLNAGENKDWDEMFYYDDQAFQMYLSAFGYCNAEPENKEKARVRLDEHRERGKLITCAYHMSEAEDAYLKSTLELDDNEDVDQSLHYAKLSMWSLNDSEKFCGHDPTRLETIKKLKDLIGDSIKILEKFVE